MPFHSFTFLLVFLPVVIAGHHFLNNRVSRGAAQSFLLTASVVFYVQPGLRNLPVIALSLGMNHIAGVVAASADEKRSRRGMMAGIVANILLLCWFKYSGTSAALPLGVSFFTIQQVRYLVDVYERRTAPDSLFDHALTIIYFPYISAGPITRPRDIVREFHSAASEEGAENVARGLIRFTLGLAKKTLLADNLAIIVNAGYGATESLGFLEAWILCCCCTLQVYFDFGGYSDMAIGVARMLGHRLPENFNNPLRARSITEFWQRWHMTLTTFITTYLYTPILRAMGKVSRAKAMIATLAAMAIAGVWHGSGAVFLIFGLLHGAGLCVHLLWKGTRRSMPDWTGNVITLAFVTLAFIFFRASDIGSAANVIAALAGTRGWKNPAHLRANAVGVALRSNFHIPAAGLVAAIVLALAGPTSTMFGDGRRFSGKLALYVCALLLLSMLLMNSTPNQGFVYAAF